MEELLDETKTIQGEGPWRITTDLDGQIILLELWQGGDGGSYQHFTFKFKAPEGESE